MAIDKYTLHKDAETEKWRLEREGSDRAKRVFENKEDALKGFAPQSARQAVRCEFRWLITPFRKNGPTPDRRTPKSLPDKGVAIFA